MNPYLHNIWDGRSSKLAHVTTTIIHTHTRTHKKSLYYAVRDKSHDDLALLTCLLYATTMRFFKRFQRALDAFLAPDDDPVRSSHAIDAGRDTPSPHVDAHDELRETP